MGSRDSPFDSPSLKYSEELISGPISPYVVVVWKMETAGLPVSFRHIPKNQSLLVLGVEKKLNPITDRVGDFFIVPAFHKSIQATINSKMVGISFIKDGLHRLSRQNMKEQGSTIPFNLASKILTLRPVFEEEDLRSVAEKTTTFLLSEMDLEPGPQGFEKAIEKIESSNGCLSIQSVCEGVGISERSLQRHFRERIGIAPKKYAKIARVNAYLHELITDESKNWMDTVVSYHYHDQPHLINEFKSIVKHAPNDLLKYRDSLYQRIL